MPKCRMLRGVISTQWPRCIVAKEGEDWSDVLSSDAPERARVAFLWHRRSALRRRPDQWDPTRHLITLRALQMGTGMVKRLGRQRPDNHHLADHATTRSATGNDFSSPSPTPRTYLVHRSRRWST